VTSCAPRLLALSLLAIAGTGCDQDFEASGHLRIASQQIRPIGSSARGARIEAGESALLVQWDADDPLAGAYAETVQGAGRRQFFAEDWWEAGRNKTNAAFLDSTVVMNWPVDRSDDALEPDRRYTVRAKFDETPSAWTVRTTVKQDDDFDNGIVRVRIVLEEQVAQRPGWAEVVQEAIQRWQEQIFGAPGVGLTLVTETVTRTLRTKISPPGFGDGDLYRSLSAERDPEWIDLVMVRDLEGGVGIYGVAGGIPGPVGESSRSAVTVSMLTSAGPDGEFSEAEIDILSETMAHEVGHYLGLFHPVEIPSGNVADSFDALDDTSECGDFEACANILANNLMFPTPVCFDGDPTIDDDPGCVRQTALTDDQEALVHRYVLVE